MFGVLPHYSLHRCNGGIPLFGNHIFEVMKIYEKSRKKYIDALTLRPTSHYRRDLIGGSGAPPDSNKTSGTSLNI